MARKGNQQRNGVDRVASNHKKRGVDSGYVGPETKGRGKVKVFPGEETPNGNHQSSPVSESGRKTHPVVDESKTKQNSGKFQRDDTQGLDEIHEIGESVPSKNDSGDFSSSSVETPGSVQANGVLPSWETGLEHVKNGVKDLFKGLPVRNVTETMQFSRNVAVRKLGALAFSILKEAGEWLEKHKPFFVRVRSNLDNACDYTKLKVGQAYPVVSKWLIHFGNLMLLLTMVWLDFTLRGIDSFIRLGTATFFSAIWCSILSVLAMVGTFNFLIVLAIAALVGAFIGLTLGVLVIAISGIIFLWLYGSFWTTLFFITIAGLTFMLRYERLALSVSTVYSIYCAWTYVGWLGLLLAFNLSFLSSDILIYFLKNTINQRRRADPSEQAAGVGGQSGFNASSFGSSFTETVPGLSSDRIPGEPSTSGVNSELTSEEEVVRLLNCSDHYSALGLSRYENVDVSLLKREYKKKAMLVHPDKNMGNEKAAEAFKKLQNAYEVLLDSLKRKVYDDELRKEELLNYFRSFQSSSQKGGEHGFFSAGLARSEVDGEDPLGEPRRIACKRCNNFHMWVLTKKSKARARWCQECGDFHQAKDGDGWLEQSSQPFFFGLLQKVDVSSAYVCADGKIYNATEWYICQGMRCPANTHKPSFHVNTSIASKFSSGKGSSSGQRSGRGPSSNMEETMTEEEFFEWLQNAVQSGLFDNVSGDASAESPSGKAGHGPKSSGGGGGSSSGNKRKKKGKKQW